MLKRLAILLVVLAVPACADSDSQPTTTPDAPTTSVASVEPDASETTVASDSTPLDTRIEWVAEALSRGEVSESEYEATFTADFVNAVTYEEFVAGLGQLGGNGQLIWSVGEFEDRDQVSSTVLLVSDGGQSLRASLNIENTAPFRISGLLLQPAEPPALDDPPADLDEAAVRLGDLAQLELGVFELTDTGCEVVFQEGSGGPMPIGSAFKLYVLGAVADSVAAGELAWDDDVAITEEHRSIPTGVLQDEEEGETFTVREMAEVMIAFSDNTATDHLMGLVGRDAAEAALADYGMADPSLNIPLMDTMDLTALKVGPAAGLATQWVDADSDGRRQILEQVSDIHPSDIPVQEFTEPVRPDVIEWFATPEDLCRVLVQLVAQDEPVTQVLSINPGLPDEDGLFDYIAFKGGSEPGVAAMNWLVERPDGRAFVVSGSLLDAEQDFDQLEANLLFGVVRDLVADL